MKSSFCSLYVMGIWRTLQLHVSDYFLLEYFETSNKKINCNIDMCLVGVLPRPPAHFPEVIKWLSKHVLPWTGFEPLT